MLTGAALATINRLPVLLLPADTFAGRSASPLLQELELPDSGDITVNDAFRPVSRYFDRIWRPEQLARRADVGDAGPDQPRRNRRGDIVLSAGRAGGGSRLAGILVREASARRATVAGEGNAGGGRGRDPPGRSRSSSRAAVHYSGPQMHWPGSARRPAYRSARARPGRAPDLRPPQCLGAIGSTGTTAANAIARDADVVIGIGTRYSDFTTASRTAFQNPDVRFVNINVAGMDVIKHAGLGVHADAREALEALLPLLDGYSVDESYGRSIPSSMPRGTKPYAAPTGPEIPTYHACSPRTR